MKPSTKTTKTKATLERRFTAAHDAAFWRVDERVRMHMPDCDVFDLDDLVVHMVSRAELAARLELHTRVPDLSTDEQAIVMVEIAKRILATCHVNGVDLAGHLAVETAE